VLRRQVWLFSSLLCRWLYIPLTNGLVCNAEFTPAVLHPGPVGANLTMREGFYDYSNPCTSEHEGRGCLDQRIFVQLLEAKRKYFRRNALRHRHS
jgi:hypothetical protein